MDILNNNEQDKVLGGGYWWLTPSGQWIYIESDEEPDGDDIICGGGCPKDRENHKDSPKTYCTYLKTYLADLLPYFEK